MDISLVRKPKFVVSVMDKKTTDQLYQDMTSSVDSKKHHIVTVNDGKGFVAVDNIAVLDAAIRANIPQIQILNIGKADHPLLTHIERSSQKEMINPARVSLAVNSIRNSYENPKISLNSYLEKILAVEFDQSITLILADMIEYVFAAGIKQSPPVSYFAALSKLEITKQRLIIEKTQILCQELKQRYFVWPNTHIFNLLINGTKKSVPQLRKSTSKSVSSFNCTCGNHYGIINNKICKLEEKNGCLISSNSVGTTFHMIPEKGVKFLGIDKNNSAKFSMHKKLDDLKKIKLDGPFLLVRLDKKE